LLHLPAAAKVKEDNSRIVALDKQLNEAQDNIAKQQDVRNPQSR
jgi:hypothetical protein